MMGAKAGPLRQQRAFLCVQKRAQYRPISNKCMKTSHRRGSSPVICRAQHPWRALQGNRGDLSPSLAALDSPLVRGGQGKKPPSDEGGGWPKARRRERPGAPCAPLHSGGAGRPLIRPCGPPSPLWGEGTARPGGRALHGAYFRRGGAQKIFNSQFSIFPRPIGQTSSPMI